MPTRDEELLYLNTEIKKLSRSIARWADTSMPAYRRTIEQRQRLITERDRLLLTPPVTRTLKNRARKKKSSEGAAVTRLGRNINNFRKECGWSFDELAEKTGIDKKLILSHVNKRAQPRPRTLKEYAQAFAKALARAVSVADLEK